MESLQGGGGGGGPFFFFCSADVFPRIDNRYGVGVCGMLYLMADCYLVTRKTTRTDSLFSV